MAFETLEWDLTHDERLMLRGQGVQRALAEHYEQNERFKHLYEGGVEVTAVKNVKKLSGGAVVDAYMQVDLSVTLTRDYWNHFSLCFNGVNPANLSEAHLTALGVCAVARPEQVLGLGEVS